jgi:hypothetical protein
VGIFKSVAIAKHLLIAAADSGRPLGAIIGHPPTAWRTDEFDPKRKLPSAQGLTALGPKAEVPFSATVVAIANRLRDWAEK